MQFAIRSLDKYDIFLYKNRSIIQYLPGILQRKYLSIIVSDYARFLSHIYNSYK